MASDRLTLKQERFIAAYLGKAQGNATEAAAMAGYRGRQTTLSAVGTENLRKPLIAEAITKGREAIKSQGIALLEGRVAAQNARWRAMQRLVEERAEAYDGEAPGAGTGLLVRQVKSIGYGAGARTVDEWATDTGLLAEMRQLEQHTAKELGQWVDRQGMTIDVSTLSDEELDTLAAGRQLPAAPEGGG